MNRVNNAKEIIKELERALDEWEYGGKEEFVRLFVRASRRHGLQAEIARGLGVTRQRINLWGRGKIGLDTAMRAFPVIVDAINSGHGHAHA